MKKSGEAAGGGEPLDRSGRKAAKRFAAEVEKLGRRHAKRIRPAHRSTLDAAVGELRSALDAGDDARARAALDALDEKADRILSFAKKSTAREYIESIVIAVGIAIFLRAFVIEAFKIPTGSMVPTLQVGDHIFVNKFIYGLRVPLTNAWFVQWGTPERGDVIVFRYPPDTSKDYIKRVVAVAGDRVAVEHGRVFVNGEPLPRRALGSVEYIQEEEDDHGRRLRGPGPTTLVAFEEQSAGRETTYTVLDDPRKPDEPFPGPDAVSFVGKVEGRRSSKDPEQVGLQCQPGESRVDPGHCVVEEGFVFVMGDNRDNSADSRTWGAAPIDNVKGKAMFVWGSWGGSWFDFRFDRLGRVIH